MIKAQGWVTISWALNIMLRGQAFLQVERDGVRAVLSEFGLGHGEEHGKQHR